MLAAGVWYAWSFRKNNEPAASIASVKDATYIIDGQPVTLVNGTAETEIAPGSASQQITKYFGNEATGDFNFDGKADVAFLLTQDNGGSGTFYYLAVALGTDKGYRGTNAMLIGDRITPKSVEFQNDEIVVNYSDRNPGEPFSVAPSLGMTKYFEIVCDQLVVPGQDPMPTCPATYAPVGNDAATTTTSTAPMLIYHNSKYNYSFQYPVKALPGPYQDDLATNTPGYPLVNYTIFEQDNDVYLRPKDYHEFNQDIVRHQAINRDGTNWCVEIQPIDDLIQLTTFVRNEYGLLCKFTLAKAGTSSDTYDVKFIYDQGGIETSGCFPYQTYVVKYSPTDKEVAFWSAGQECQLALDNNWPHNGCFDQKIADSFAFGPSTSTAPRANSIASSTIYGKLAASPYSASTTFAEINSVVIDQTDWQAYSNDQFSFQIYTPPDWVFSGELAPLGSSLSLQPQNAGDSFFSPIFLGIQENTSTASAWLKQNNVGESAVIIIPGSDGAVAEIINDGTLVVVVKKGDKEFDFTAQYPAANILNQDAMLEAVAKTIRFTN